MNTFIVVICVYHSRLRRQTHHGAYGARCWRAFQESAFFLTSALRTMKNMRVTIAQTAIVNNTMTIVAVTSSAFIATITQVQGQIQLGQG